MRSLLALLAATACGSPPTPATTATTARPRPAAAPLARPATLSEASIAADLAWLVDPARAGRGSSSPEAIATAQWLVSELRAAGYAPVLQPIPSVRGQSNVIATYDGPPGKTSLVVAHYDHLGVIGGVMYPGADDNASGVAVALAIARDLAAKHDVPGRVVFLFTGAEEIDLNGAKAFVAAPTVPLASIHAVYNFDMVGRNFFASAANQPNTLAAVGLPQDADTQAIALAAARETGLELVAVPPGLLTMVGEDKRSDDWVFRAQGLFAVHFSSGLNADYHHASDTLEKVSIPQLVKLATLVRTILARTR